jgi:hypothetical protein
LLSRSLALLLWAPAALASVGTISSLEGSATRTARGVETPLKEGSGIELNDLIRVKTGALKLTLTDTSEIMLAQGADLTITEADFAGQERRSFSARLGFGALWARVTKALSGSNAKFEIQTERAVAGVRGTTFQVEVVNGSDGPETHIGVIEGEVGVARWVPPPMAVASREPTGSAHAAAKAMAMPTMAPAPAAAPAPPPPPSSAQIVSKGQSIAVSGSTMKPGPVRTLPPLFDAFVKKQVEERPRPEEHRDDRREEHRDRRK